MQRAVPDRAQWDPDNTSRANEARAVRVVERFARLQAEHGPWRLAWLKALVKAADAFVSAESQRIARSPCRASSQQTGRAGARPRARRTSTARARPAQGTSTGPSDRAPCLSG